MSVVPRSESRVFIYVVFTLYVLLCLTFVRVIYN